MGMKKKHIDLRRNDNYGTCLGYLDVSETDGLVAMF
jgi:hypothetical protein